MSRSLGDNEIRRPFRRLASRVLAAPIGLLGQVRRAVAPLVRGLGRGVMALLPPTGRGLAASGRAIGRAFTSVVWADRRPEAVDRAIRRLIRWLPAFNYAYALMLFLPGIVYTRDNTDLPYLLVPIVAAVIVLPLVFLPRLPLAAWIVLLALGVLAPVIYETGGMAGWPPALLLTGIVVLPVVAARSRPRTVFAMWATTTLGNALALQIAGQPLDHLAGGVIVITGCLLLGYFAGGHYRLERELAEGERRRKEEGARRALLEERARIAREMHDVVAHHMSMIAVQAETAPYRLPNLPEEGKQSLAQIGATAREALTEMRRLLGVLRSETGDSERAPQPGLEGVHELIAGARRAGLTVTARLDDEDRPLRPGVGLSAYRIIQEALSNAARHAPGARVDVEVTRVGASLRVRVVNDAPTGARPTSAVGAGHGLLGMRERATMLGGRLDARPGRHGGYEVEAILPLDTAVEPP